MQPWLHPTQASTSRARPRAAFSTRSGSAISARVMPTASAAPEATRRSAAARSTIRVVPITGTSTAARTRASGPAIADSAAGGGGAIQLEAAT
jgi:hypothetical protein